MATQGEDLQVQELCEAHTDVDEGQLSEAAPSDSSPVRTYCLDRSSEKESILTATA